MKIYCKLISIVFILGLFSCERVQSLEGLVVDVHNVPLDSVLISDDLMNFRMRTDSLGRFRYMIMLPTTSQGIDTKFSFSKKGFIDHSQTIKVYRSTKVIVVMNRDTIVP
jgi:hypothetical protein